MPGIIAESGGLVAYNSQQKAIHKERNAAQAKIWAEVNKEEIAVKMKKSHVKNKERNNAQTKKYHAENKAVLAAKRIKKRENEAKILCECCGFSFIKENLKKHHKSAKYLKNMASKA